MPASSHPSPQFSPLQRVVVIEKPPPDPGCGGVIGEHAVIIWRSSHFVGKSRYGNSGRLYVVHFSVSNTYERVEESRLAAIGGVVPLASCLGRDFEISYDRHGTGPAAIAGTFRIPGGFWNIFEFRNEKVERPTYEIRIPIRFYTGIAKYTFTVPQTVLLDCQYIEEMMSNVLDAASWRRIVGPESGWLC
jgi:hypothetical protein